MSHQLQHLPKHRFLAGFNHTPPWTIERAQQHYLVVTVRTGQVNAFNLCRMALTIRRCNNNNSYKAQQRHFSAEAQCKRPN
jgi:hypothetical protein